MERFTISLDEGLAREFDRLIERRGYANRSEAVRDLLRGLVEQERTRHDAGGHCVAALSYVYNHHERELAERLTALQHEHHDLATSTLHVHLDHDHCLETAVLRGATGAVQAFAQRLMAERGVRHGQLNLVSVELDESRHGHGGGRRGAAAHVHLRPRS
jgi:CopG family nickel-responsive transcriptional regulator